MERRELPQADCLVLADGLSNQKVHRFSSGCGWYGKESDFLSAESSSPPATISPSSRSSSVLGFRDFSVDFCGSSTSIFLVFVP